MGPRGGGVGQPAALSPRLGSDPLACHCTSLSRIIPAISWLFVPCIARCVSPQRQLLSGARSVQSWRSTREAPSRFPTRPPHARGLPSAGGPVLRCWPGRSSLRHAATVVVPVGNAHGGQGRELRPRLGDRELPWHWAGSSANAPLPPCASIRQAQEDRSAAEGSQGAPSLDFRPLGQRRSVLAPAGNRSAVARALADGVLTVGAPPSRFGPGLPWSG
jgi:hypothetical protein